MKVLFVSSGNSNTGISPIVKKQGESLQNEGMSLSFFTIKGKGVLGYLKNINKLKRRINEYQPDLIHAHYSLCGFVSALTKPKQPIVTSLMGSDAASKKSLTGLIKYFKTQSWSHCIVKSEEMKISLGFEDISIIPNGVDLEMFQSQPKAEAQQKLGWSKAHRHILFGANPDRAVKNFDLTNEAFNQFKAEYPEVQLHVLKDKKHEDIPLLMNASDIMVLSSLREGSPNVVKEAMACSVPIVATNVGDVAWLFGDVPGHYVSDFNASDMKHQLVKALNFDKKTEGRERILNLGLDDQSTAKRIINIYKSLRC
jgi:glycosyltransferase involved in cell wall biosynthesis